MLSIFKKLFRKPEPKAVAAPAAPAAPLATNTSIPTIEVAHLSLAAVVERFPDDLKPLITGTPDPAATVALPIPTILKQLPTGTVKMSLASLHRQAHGLIKPLPPGDKRSIEIPLSEVFRHVRLELLRRRPDQRRAEVPENGFNLFGDTSNPHLIAPDDVVAKLENGAESEPHVLDLTLDMPNISADAAGGPAPRVLKMDDGLKAHFGNGTNSHPAEAHEAVEIAESSTPAARAERARILAAPPEFAGPPRLTMPPMPATAPVSPEPAPLPVLELSLAPQPVLEIEPESLPVAEHVITLELEPESETEQQPEASAPSATAETLAPAEPLPAAEPAATTEPSPVAVSLPQHEESHPAQAEPQPTPEPPVAIQPTEPAPPVATPEPNAPTSAVARPEGPTLSLPITSLAANWPDEIRAEISALDPATTVALPVNAVTAGLTKGRVAFTWKEIHSWLEPHCSAPSAIAGDTVLQLPLKVVAPAFLKSKKPAMERKTVDMDETIPALFNGGRTPEPAPAAPVTPATAEPAAESAPEAPPAAPGKLPETVGEVFRQPQKESWTPAEIVAGTVTLPGVAGAVLALQEGLVVASSLPQGVKSEVVAAFLPQIFARLNQYAGEMRLGEVDDLLFTTHGAHCQIYRLGYIYFGVLGKEGASLPWHELRLICEELARQTHK